MKLALYYEGNKYEKICKLPIIECDTIENGTEYIVNHLKNNFNEMIGKLGDSEFIHFTICKKEKNYEKKYYQSKWNYKVLYTGRIYSPDKCMIFDETAGEWSNV